MTLSAVALADLAEIGFYTERVWGHRQSLIYEDFLFDLMHSLESNELSGKPLRSVPNCWYYLAKWPGADHGHYIVFEWIGESIFVRALVHSASNFQF